MTLPIPMLAVCPARDATRPSPVRWHAWRPTERAVLCFVRRSHALLLIHKKRGLGAGKINAPGGRIEAGESPAQAAVRETREEVGVTAGHLRQAGRLRFAFVDGFSLQCEVFTAQVLSGTIAESDEALPFWCPIAAIPYDDMWADDRFWLPLLLEGRDVAGRFIFEGDRLLWRHVRARQRLSDDRMAW